jgi:hypothetical protein
LTPHWKIRDFGDLIRRGEVIRANEKAFEEILHGGARYLEVQRPF